jgi:PAS domain S-box-containing protein
MPLSPVAVWWAVLATIGVCTILGLYIIGLSVINNRRIRDSEFRFLYMVFVDNQRIRESQNRFRLLFEQAFDLMVTLDWELRIINANEAFYRLPGQSREKTSHAKPLDFVAEGVREGLQREFQKCLASGMSYFGETELSKGQGECVQYEVGATCLKIDGRRYLLASFRDISERKLVEEELRSKNAALNEIMRHIESEKLKFKQEIAETIEQEILPALHKTLRESNPGPKGYLLRIERSLQDLATFSKAPRDSLKNLSLREIQICELIRDGALSKDIADTLHLSEFTVRKHRERIRKKLGISNKNISLTDFLRQS